MPSSTPFVRKLSIKNYKSIDSCEVELGPLTFLVGPNGSGKSNFLDALRLVADGLRTSLEHALRDRGGIHEVRRRSQGHPTHFWIRVDFSLPCNSEGFYEFRIGSKKAHGYIVQKEECQIWNPLATLPSSQETFHFLVESGKVSDANFGSPPAAEPDRLYLVNVSGLPQFRRLFDALSRMVFYNPNPGAIRIPQPPDLGELLVRDGCNVASVLGTLAEKQPELKQRIEEYLQRIVPGLQGADRKSLGHLEAVEFRQQVAGSDQPWRFPASCMSDGTLRALSLLIALFQHPIGDGAGTPLVGIEEPEIALHPGALGVLLDGLLDASRKRQVLVTSHSSDLLDDPRITDDCILAVTRNHQGTHIAPLDEASRSAIRDRLYTAGELMRINQLEPECKSPGEPKMVQGELFEAGDSE